MFFKKKSRRSISNPKGKIINIENNKRFKKSSFVRKRNILFNFKNIITINTTKKTFVNIAISSIVLLFLGIILVLFGPTFTIKDIEIKNVENNLSDELINIDISYDSVKDFRGKNIFLLDKKDLSHKIINSQKNIENVSIDTILPNKLKIILTSSKPIFNSKINNSNYLITDNGVAIPTKKQNNKLKNIKIEITNGFTDRIISYQKVIDKKNINDIFNIYNKIEDNILGIKIEEIKFYNIENEVLIKIKGGAIIIFGLDGDVENQIEKLVQFNTENKDGLNVKNDGIYYIDLRIPEKVFVCKKETENDCKLNLLNIYGN